MTINRDIAIQKLHDGADPFRDFDPTGWADPTDRWDSHHPWFAEAVRELHPRVIVEVGHALSWEPAEGVIIAAG